MTSCRSSRLSVDRHAARVAVIRPVNHGAVFASAIRSYCAREGPCPARSRSSTSPWQVEARLEEFDWIRNGGADAVTADVREVTGENARPVEDWLSEFRGAFLSPPDASSAF